MAVVQSLNMTTLQFVADALRTASSPTSVDLTMEPGRKRIGTVSDQIHTGRSAIRNSDGSGMTVAQIAAAANLTVAQVTELAGRLQVAVAFDAANTPFLASASTSFTDTSLTIGSISNGVLIVMLQLDALVSTLVLKWDSTGGSPQTMTQIGFKKATDTGWAYLYGLRGPHTGNKTLAGSWVTSADYIVEAASFSGADQAADGTTFKNVVSNASSPASTGNYPTSGLAITTISGDMAVGSFSTFTGQFNSGAGLGTQIGPATATNSGSARYLAAVGASTTIAENQGFANVPCSCVGCAIAQVSVVQHTEVHQIFRVKQGWRF